MLIETVRFGKIEIDDSKILRFDEGLPGLEDFRGFAVVQVEESYPIIWLQSIEDGEVCLPVVESFLVMPDYAFDISDEDVSVLGLSSHDDLKVVSVLVIPENIDAMTVNLAAPIIINLQNGCARQIILNSSEYSVRVPIFKAILKFVKGENADAGAIKEA